MVKFAPLRVSETATMSAFVFDVVHQMNHTRKELPGLSENLSCDLSGSNEVCASWMIMLLVRCLAIGGLNSFRGKT